MLSVLTATAAERGFSACLMEEFSNSCGDFGFVIIIICHLSSAAVIIITTHAGDSPQGTVEEEEGGKQELGALRCQPVLLVCCS